MRLRMRVMILLLSFCLSGSSQEYHTLSEKELKSRIEGYWLGQLVGNYMGFPFEFVYFEEPVPVLVDRYYTHRDTTDLRMNLDRRGHVDVLAEALGGAWTDDDTDIEFTTLHAVEQYGLDISYAEIAEAWKRHINRFIWGSNRQARNLMDIGLIPPETGSKLNNPYWFFIDPQLVNEIWSVFYPGMVEKAVGRAEWGARITNDDWGTHPTLFYAALYSAAFVEEDIAKLYETGMASVPSSSPFLVGLKDVRKWYETHEDWRDTRDLIYQHYYHYPADTLGHNAINAIINGLFGAMAILYGEGDFLRTTGIAVSAGLDCDNQAATCAGFIGILKGAEAIPADLTRNLGPGTNWEAPFNNTYINYARDELPNLTPISDIVDRIYKIAEQAILENGGIKTVRNEEIIYQIPLK